MRDRIYILAMPINTIKDIYRMLSLYIDSSIYGQRAYYDKLNLG